ncbi:MAG: putative AlkP superfamily phosphohydrolase/phosphomutase [Chlamydiales bacterium]|jgi:predicted AlkP superfamily phosphohydrolase/phosphomutase
MLHYRLLHTTSTRDAPRWPARFAPLGLLVAALVTGAGCFHQESPQPEHRLLIIGWDGATFDLIDPLLAEGRLPNVARMLERGTSADLDSTIIPISSAAWVGAVTGKGPGKTGVYSFFEPVEDSYDVQVVSSRSNRAVPIWRILGARGLGVHVMGVPITYPPETVPGTLISGMLSPFDANYAHPHGLADDLRERGFEPDLGIWRTDHGPTPVRLTTQLGLKRDIALEHLGRDDWAFSMIVFKSLDVVSHGIYSEQLDGPVPMLLNQLDGILGELLDAVGEDTNVILMSDHGFRTYPETFNLHAWMVDEGFSPKHAHGTAEAVAPGQLALVRPKEHERRMGELDLSQTVAFAAACEGNFGSIRLNLAGREPQGVVAPEDAQRVLAEITERLLETQVDGRSLVTHVIPGHDFYPGPESERIVPDLLFETDTSFQVMVSPDKPTFTRNARPFPDHARTGILIAAGPDFAPCGRDATRPKHSVLDIAPLALHLLDLPVAREMDGQVPANLLRPGSPVQFVREADDPRWPRARDAARHFEFSDSGDSTDVQDRLRSLGYVE